MGKVRFDAEFEDFYNTCLTELQSRPNFTEAWVPQLERFVTITAKLAKLNSEIVDEEVTVDHTNKANKTNKATSPAWRMFIALDSQANALADKLKLSPHTAPVSTKKQEKKGFDLTPMKITKTG
jgi:hypothetical protein